MTERLEKPTTKRASKRMPQRTTKQAIKQITKRTAAGFLALLLLMSSPATMQGFASPAGMVSGNDTGQAALPANPIHHCTKEDDGTDYTDFSYIYFGSYPQSEVRDNDTIAAIDSAIMAGDAAKAVDDAGVDVWVNGIKYRRIAKTDANDSGYFDDVENNGYRYFKWERIKWRVLDNNDNGTMFVMADNALDCECYNDEHINIPWENSTIRNWLNGSFYQAAFSNEEQSAIEPWQVVNEDNPDSGIEGGNDTTDHVYLLSIGEVTKERYGFCSDNSTDSASRRLQTSEYTRARGIWRNISSGHENNCAWWLRSPGYDGMIIAAFVGEYGGVCRNLYFTASFFRYEGVVPVLHINLSSDLWSMEDDGSSGEGGGTSTGGNQNPSNPQPDPSHSKYSGKSGDLDWTIDTTGHLVISGTGDYESLAWQDYSDEIKSATVQVTGITSMRYMFYGCSRLSSVDVSGLDTSKVTDMEAMFYGCSRLSSVDVSGFDTSNVTNMDRMFNGCSSLSSLDISGFNMGNVTDMRYMFWGCSSLTTLTLPANIQQSVELPYYIYDSAAGYYVKSNSFVWQDSNGQTCEYAIENLPTKMTYKKVMKGQENTSNPKPNPAQSEAPQPTGTSLTASQVTSRTDTVPQGASFTVTSSDSANPTVSFDGVSDVNAAAVTIPKTITYNGVEYKVTTVSPTAFSTKKDKASFAVTDNRLESLTVEYKSPSSNAKKTKVTVPETTTYKGIKFKVTSVAAKSFKNNKKVKQVSIAGSVTKIGDSSFEGCTSLKSVTLGKGTASIGKSTFKNCKNLTKITIKSTKLKKVGKNALKGINAKCKIKVPAKQLKKYQKLFQKKGQKSSVKVVK